ncbi:MAG TPA: NADH-quinone oxidoreductase subunit M [Methanothrix sp.]|nr:NADH-quinone oxidoreductase subunit M [Methanothrix sp.]
MPDAHVEAPTAGSVLLAALLLKMGGYGLFRVVMPMLPNVSANYITLMAVIGVVSIVYGGFLALSQKDLKKMVAYSSVSHMGYVLLGAGALSVLSVQGAMFQQFSHGLITCVLFMSAGTIQHTAGTRIISELGGLSDRMPKFAVLMMAGFMASLGLPGMCGFVAELSVLAGSYQNLPVYVLIVIFGGIAVTAGYHLWAMQKVMFGPILKKYLDLKDPHSYEILSMSILILLIIYFGVQPATIMDIMEVAAKPLVDPFTTMASTGVI